MKAATAHAKAAAPAVDLEDAAAISQANAEAVRSVTAGIRDEGDQLVSKQTHTISGKEWRCRQAATDALSNKIEDQSVTCPQRDKVRYGRIVAVCRAAARIASPRGSRISILPPCRARVHPTELAARGWFCPPPATPAERRWGRGSERPEDRAERHR